MSPTADCDVMNLTEALAEEIGTSIDAVVKIHAIRHDNVIEMLTVIDDRSMRTLEAISGAEVYVTEMHPDIHFRFDMVELSDYSDSVGAPVAYAR